MKQNVIKITATIHIPFDPDKWGDTHRAEQLASTLMDSVKTEPGVNLDVWQAKKCKVEV